MRVALFAVVPLVAAVACASAPQHLRPADPAQTLAGEPRAAAASASGVRVTVRPAEASGWVVDERLTPVEVAVDNRSGRSLDLRPGRFALVLPDGARLAALTPQEARRRVGPSTRSASDVVQVYQRSPSTGVYFPWGTLPATWAGVWAAAPLPPAAALERKAVGSGESAVVLLLFALPPARLDRFELDAELVDPAGEGVATVRVPFDRGQARPEAVPPAPTATPPPSAG